MINWSKIKTKYPLAFQKFKKCYLLYELYIEDDLILMNRADLDNARCAKGEFESISENIVESFLCNNGIAYNVLDKKGFYKSFKRLNKKLIGDIFVSQPNREVGIYSHYFGKETKPLTVKVNEFTINGNNIAIDIDVNIILEDLKEGMPICEFIHKYKLDNKIIILNRMLSNTEQKRPHNPTLKELVLDIH